jgi:hypothetical protein
MAATLGRQAEPLAQLATDVRFVLFQVDRAYARVIGDVGLRDVHDINARAAQVNDLHCRWQQAVQRLWQDGGPVIASDPAEPREPTHGRSAGGG